MRKAVCCFLIIALAFCTFLSHAENAQVKTPSGPLNMRQEPNTKAGQVARIPNNAIVTFIEQVDDTWSKINYKGSDGYVQTRYLDMAKTAEGKTVYPDANGPVYLRKTASDDGTIIHALASVQPITVLSVNGQWAKVSCADESGETITGYVLTSRIAGQHAQPQTKRTFLNEKGVMRGKQTLYHTPSKAGEKAAALPKGQAVNVQYIEGSWCYVTVDSVTAGFVPTDRVQLTGEVFVSPDSPLMRYTAAYYLCTVPSGALNTYVEPTGDLEGQLRQTIPIDPKEKLPVVKHAYLSHDRTWAQVIHNGSVYWTPSSSIKLSSETEEMHYAAPIQHFTTATAYARQGCQLYAAGSAFSKALCAIPAGTELLCSLGDDFISTTYKGKAGYVMYDDVVCGLAEVMDGDKDWRYYEHLNDPAPAPTPTLTPAPPIDESQFISKSDARAKADAALAAAYNAKNLSKMTVRSEACPTKRGITGPLYEFAYFRDGKYLYNVLINALTGKAEFTADYTNFAQTVDFTKPTPKPTRAPIAGELSPAEAKQKADAFLRANYGSIDAYQNMVENLRIEKMPGYDTPVYRLNYWAGEGQFGFTCIVGARDGKILYHTNIEYGENTELDYSTPSPTPYYESTADIGIDEARRIGKAYLAGKYPDFSTAVYTEVNGKQTESNPYIETPYYYFHFMVTDHEFFSVSVHAYTGQVLYSTGGLPGEGNG